MPCDHAHHDVVVGANQAGLDEQAFLQSPCGHARGIKFLNPPQDFFRLFNPDARLLRDLVKRSIQISVGRQVADDEQRHPFLRLRKIARQLELPLEMIEE